MAMFEGGMGLVSAWMGNTGKKPKVPPYPTVDMEQEQSAAIKQNIASLSDIGKLASKYNSMTSDELLKQMEKLAPGTMDLQKQGTNLIKSYMAGEIPADVASQIRRNSAQGAVAGGYSGSSIQRNLTARDLGLTSLQLMDRGISAGERWIQQARASAGSTMMDFSSMFVTPAQRINFKGQENAAKFNRDWLSNQIYAMPSPTEQAWDEALRGMGQTMDQAAGAAMSFYGGGGGAMGSIGGMPGSQQSAARGYNTSQQSWNDRLMNSPGWGY